MEENRKIPTPYDSSTTQQVSLMKSQNIDTIRWILDYNPELKDFERDLKGEIKTEQGWRVDEKLRSVNDVGVREIIKRLKLPFSKGTVLSNMSDTQICDDAREFNIQFVYDCYRHHDDWGFKSYVDRSSVIVQTSLLYHRLLLRAKGALQLKQLSESIERQEKVMYGQQQNKPTPWWQIWKGGSGGKQ